MLSPFFILIVRLCPLPSQYEYVISIACGCACVCVCVRWQRWQRGQWRRRQGVWVAADRHRHRGITRATAHDQYQ